jgi:hypothetical protein
VFRLVRCIGAEYQGTSLLGICEWFDPDCHVWLGWHRWEGVRFAFSHLDEDRARKNEEGASPCRGEGGKGANDVKSTVTLALTIAIGSESTPPKQQAGASKCSECESVVASRILRTTM